MLAWLIRSFLIFIATIGIACALDVKTYIPPQAHQYLPLLNDELSIYYKDFYLDQKHYFAGLIEHESCISLTHSKCWNPSAELRTAREQGVGVGQLTRAFNPDGSTRFDILSELKTKHSVALKELSWSNIKQRPDLHIEAS